MAAQGDETLLASRLQLIEMFKDNLIYLRECLSQFRATGTFWPSSRWAAEALASPVRGHNSGAIRILEAGPGAGVVTLKILSYMRDGDSLMICEINPRFMEALRSKLANNPDYLRHKERVSFFLGPVQDLPEEAKYELIICAIPFLNLELAVVEEIFQKLKRLSSERTLMTYFEYIALRKLGMMVASPQRKQRLEELDGFFKSLFSNHHVGTTQVWMNLLPINIYTLKLAA